MVHCVNPCLIEFPKCSYGSWKKVQCDKQDNGEGPWLWSLSASFCVM